MFHQQNYCDAQPQEAEASIYAESLVKFFHGQPEVHENVRHLEDYLQGRVCSERALPEHIVVSMGLSRLDCLLEEGRKNLAGMFSEQEMDWLINAYNNEILSVLEIEYLASDAAEYHGFQKLAPLEKHATDAARFVRKLRQLGLLERHALADIIERTWHTPKAKLVGSFSAFMESLGLRLAD